MDRMRYVAVALVAGTVGAAVALLLAPDTGQNTRRKIARRARHERDLIARRGRRLVDEAGNYLDERVREGRRVAEGVTDRLQEGRKKVAKLIG